MADSSLADFALPYKVPPWAHQRKGVELATRDGQSEFAFLFEIGTGKTSTAINTLRALCYRYGRVLRTLILTPPITLPNWKREFGVHSAMTPTLARGTAVERWAAIGDLKGDPIIATNYESLLMSSVMKALEEFKPEVLICDESQRLKNISAKRTKLTIKLADMTHYRMILTGTAILNTPMDLFSQWRVLDKGETFGPAFWAFKSKFFYDKNANMPKSLHFPDWKIKPGAEVHLNYLISKKCLVAKKAECLDLPPFVKEQVYVELSDEQRKAYNAMKKDFVALFENGEAAVATLAVTKGLKLMQIASGFVTTERVSDGKKSRRRFADNPRQVALADLLEELCSDHKVIVWASFRDNYEAIADVCTALGYQFVQVHGDISAKLKDKAVADFERDPACRVLIGHPKAGGIGINLVAASYSIFYSRSFSLEDDLQAEGRNYRGGSEIHEKITRIDIIARDTIDEKITVALAAKKTISDKILREISEEL